MAILRLRPRLAVPFDFKGRILQTNVKWSECNGLLFVRDNAPEVVGVGKAPNVN